ncbi:MAG: hypothetical protein GXO47_06180 [Chlorobi bacterium]|nr:hypothetical protein [Chlorobiota bacterium]
MKYTVKKCSSDKGKRMRNFNLNIIILFAVLFFVCGCEMKEKKYDSQVNISLNQDSLKWKKLNQQALEGTMIPVRPGKPGEVPFWNIHAKRFINVPSFDFKEIPGSVKYRFTAISDYNVREYTFEADKPWATLSGIWKEVPVGIVYLRVEGLDKEGAVTGLSGSRLFYKAASFNGPYKSSVTDYRAAALLNLRSLLKMDHFRRWETDTIPSSEYILYSYPSKIVGSVVDAMCLLYNNTSSQLEKKLALKIAENAATYLINISQPSGTPLEYFPPTYLAVSDKMELAKRRENQVMVFYTSNVAMNYLDLYEITSDKKYLELAIKIAGTYKKLQLRSGTWPMMVKLDTGEPIGDNLTVPTDILNFFDRLIEEYAQRQFEDVYEKAFNWIMNNPMKTFNWEAQFEDMGFSKNYKNLEKGKPLDFATILLKRSTEHSEYIKMAEELLRYAEDQFLVWEKPLPREMFRTEEKPIPGNVYLTDNWFTPCALEQYGFYTPIDASMDDFIRAFTIAYQITGNKLYLVKAISLANNLTVAQSLSGGLFPTTMIKFPVKYENMSAVGDDNINEWTGWMNCATYSSKTLLQLDVVNKQK